MVVYDRVGNLKPPVADQDGFMGTLNWEKADEADNSPLAYSSLKAKQRRKHHVILARTPSPAPVLPRDTLVYPPPLPAYDKLSHAAPSTPVISDITERGYHMLLVPTSGERPPTEARIVFLFLVFTLESLTSIILQLRSLRDV
ncbi:hypothetical protein J6590_023067 [Homalodisca vitripennis]|nr:hypothetical protein J6590_023067 [Homalodisca vitripennis]